MTPSSYKMKYKLDDIDKKTDFKVPEGYFEDLPMRIQKRIEEEQTAKSTFKLPVWSFAMAASVALIVTFFFVFSGNENTAEQLLAEISEEDLIAYLDELEIDEYDLASAFPETTNELIFEKKEMLDDIEFGDESIDNILLEYNIQVEDLEI